MSKINHPQTQNVQGSTYPFNTLSTPQLQLAKKFMGLVLDSSSVIPSSNEQLNSVAAALFSANDFVFVSKTGSGKSITFLACALYMSTQSPPLITMLISPLMALLRSQLSGYSSKYPRVPAFGMDVSPSVILSKGGLVIMHPSQVLSDAGEMFLNCLHKSVGRIFIDESHLYTTCAEWRFDLLPAIRYLRNMCAKAPIVALTATCPPFVFSDLKERVLSLRTLYTIRSCINRDELVYSVHSIDEEGRGCSLRELCMEFITTFKNELAQTTGTSKCIIYIENKGNHALFKLFI